MPRFRPLPSADELLAALAEEGVTDAPREGPAGTGDEGLRTLLDMALFAAELRKKVSFPHFSWADPAFLARDAKVTLRVAYAELPGDTADALELALAANLPRLSDGRTLLGLDAHRTQAREFDLGHALYGQVTLFQWPHKPPQSADPRIDAAMEKGWAKTLKTHNLVPGRGIVVLDEHQGLLLRDDRFRSLCGLMLLLPDGRTELWWNPFSDRADPELQYWPSWADGTGPASGWKQVFQAEDARGED